MVNIINSAQCCSNPQMKWTIQYEHRRSGADMQYRFYWKVWLVYSYSWYEYGLNLQLFIDGVQNNITVKNAVVGEKGWSHEGTTGWYTVKNKTTGSTSFYARLYNVDTKAIVTTSSTYNLTVSGAASVLGSIANFTIGNNITIPITKYDSTFADTLVISYGSTTIKTVANIANGAKVSFTSAELTTIYGLMKTVNSGTFTFVLTTKSGSTTLGSSTKTATGSITSANPTFTASQVTYADTNSAVYGITGNNQHIVQNKSSLRVAFGSATGNKGASITQYSVTVNGVAKTATASGYLDFGAVNTSQNTKITVVVKDSRGNTTAVTKDVTVLAYSSPKMAVTLERLNNYEDETYLTVNASIASVNGKNTMTITYQKAQSGGSYGAVTTLTNNTKHTTSCDKDFNYTFVVTVADKFETVRMAYSLPKGRFPLFIDTEKNAVGINEFPSDGEALRVAGGVARFDGGVVAVGGNVLGRYVTDNSAQILYNAGVGCIGNGSNAGLLLMVDTTNPSNYVFCYYHFITGISNIVKPISANNMSFVSNIYGTVSARDVSGNEMAGKVTYVVMPCFAIG